jgi:hypothetical protein
VALAGNRGLLVAATAEDAAAYAREPSARGQRATPRVLAEFWTALLQDHLTLFVQRQRPLRVVEMSPRGKVFLDLFSEAERTGRCGRRRCPHGSSGRWTPSLGRVVPGPGPTAPERAVRRRGRGGRAVGRHHAGDGGGARGITIELRLDGTRLTGSLTTRSRAVAMAVPLTDIRYEKGRLAFVTATGGATHEWTGAVKGAAIDGTIRQGTKDVGGFSLRYAE